MKPPKRLIAGLLSLLMTSSLCTVPLAAAAAESQSEMPAVDSETQTEVQATDSEAQTEVQAANTETQTEVQATGSITLTVRFDLPQKWEAVKARRLTLAVGDSSKTTTVSLADASISENGLEMEVSVTALNTSGIAMTTEEVIGAYEITLTGLKTGVCYSLNLTGDGYAIYSRDVTLTDYSQHIVIGTGDGTFALGDLNGDGQVDNKDLTNMKAYLEGKTNDSLDKYDLNDDGKVDVTDLAYVNHTCEMQKVETVYDTSLIVSGTVNAPGMQVTGTLSELFESERTVTIAPQTSGGPIELSITPTKPTEVNEIAITCPDSEGAILTGTAIVECDDGTELQLPFDANTPAGVHAIGRTAGQKTVTIELGKRVAVKKITIQVTSVVGQDGQPEFATITQISFLKDIVPENLVDSSLISGLSAQPGDGKVDLVWRAVNSVTGYQVKYGTEDDQLTQTLSVNTNRATVTGLKNLSTYYFQVVATSDHWSGTPSDVISATPYPAAAPGAPSNIQVEAANEALRITWSKTKDADFYQVYYRVSGESQWLQSGGNLTVLSTVISGLTNGTVYEVAVKAGNEVGVGPYSAVASGTPKLEVIQMPELPTDGRIENSQITSVVQYTPNNVDKTLCPNFTTDHLIDNDASTYWVARVWWESSQFTYTLDQPQDMNYLILVPYLSAGHKKAIKTYTLTIRDANGNVLLDNQSYRAPNMTDQNYLILPFPAVKGAKTISLGLSEHEGNGYRVSVSEVAFYRSDSLADDIAALFTDQTFTKLNSGVTSEQIAALRTRLEEKSNFYLDLARLRDELNLADGLLQNQNVLGVVKSDFQSRSTGLDTSYGQSASDLQPLGVSVKAGATIAIYAELPEDQPVYVVPTQFFGESGVWKGAATQLHQGRNYITVPKIGDLTDERGGPLYLTYAGSKPGEIRVHVRGDSNLSAIPVLELSSWYDMTEQARKEAIQTYVVALTSYVGALGASDLQKSVYNTTEISTPSVLLSIPANQALAGLRGVGNSTEQMVEVMYQNVLAWEDEMFVANKVQGIIASNATLTDYRYPMTTRQNIRYMRMFAGAFMYAAGAHIGVGYGSTAALVQGKPASATGAGKTNQLFGWGIAHEIGHNMDKLGKAETTNNIYSLALQAWDGSTMKTDTRLSNFWDLIWSKTAAARPGAASNVFVQLGMYWQLHLAYDEGEEPLKFYNEFFKLWKSGSFSSYTYDERVALIASQVANRNLTDFFTRWGMTLSDQVKTTLNGYAAESRAIWYLNDDSRTYRLNNGAANAGTTTCQVSVQDNVTTLTIANSDAASVLGYEILRNGTSIGFAPDLGTGASYQDNLGAANNLTYIYSVITVDRLGNKSEPVATKEVRVAYDKAIDSSLYDIAQSTDGTVTFTVKSGVVSVTGVKLTGSTNISQCQVQVKGAANEEWTTVTLQANAQVDEAKGTCVSYFTKPGADASDTRLWTYDVAAVQITGLPANTTASLLDYPGDRIDFYPDATVGTLESDYHYGDGADDVIPKGTMVILGTYRGDPVYNTVEIQATYNTAKEADETQTTITRAMNGYALLFAEIPQDGQVSDISDGFFLFVPDLEAERATNAANGIPEEFDLPLEIKARLYRDDVPDDHTNSRITSETLWISFPAEGTLPAIALQGN